MKIALTIAGSDSCGGAGIQADLKTFQAHGVFGMSVITALTAQNTQKVVSVHEAPAQFVTEQIECLLEDVAIDAIKIGMVSSSELIHAIAGTLRKIKKVPIVVDPVMISKSGYPLLQAEARDALKNELIPLATVVTPNIFEAEALASMSISTLDQMREAAIVIAALGPRNVVVKGGHLEAQATDVLYDGTACRQFPAVRFATSNTHGTGCTFSSAIAAQIASGKPVHEAVRLAKDYIHGAIEHALAIGKGHGPTNHFYDLYRRAGIAY
ncbi:MAG: bifunctional hydroxymethylpyrimidine kinase/phosphomethylpyrimidine kinase [Chitinivibrionales bacterium]|nr:bifunctional hydroxymethylpyrimidine kinase/phosphomethylpyrimidine kinase [Chitinivibrionales bacterium]